MSVILIIDFQQIGFRVVDVTSRVYDLFSNGLMFVGYEQSLVMIFICILVKIGKVP
jgi:hypothetical protein